MKLKNKIKYWMFNSIRGGGKFEDIMDGDINTTKKGSDGFDWLRWCCCPAHTRTRQKLGLERDETQDSPYN